MKTYDDLIQEEPLETQTLQEGKFKGIPPSENCGQKKYDMGNGRIKHTTSDHVITIETKVIIIVFLPYFVMNICIYLTKIFLFIPSIIPLSCNIKHINNTKHNNS